jgi:hypothetical protein
MEVLDRMAGEELVPLPMDMEVCDIRASTGIACLFVVRISGMKIQETAEKTALFFAGKEHQLIFRFGLDS